MASEMEPSEAKQPQASPPAVSLGSGIFPEAVSAINGVAHSQAPPVTLSRDPTPATPTTAANKASTSNGTTGTLAAPDLMRDVTTTIASLAPSLPKTLEEWAAASTKKAAMTPMEQVNDIILSATSPLRGLGEPAGTVQHVQFSPRGPATVPATATGDKQSDSRPGTSARTKTLEYVGLPRGGQRYRSTTQVTRGINRPPYTAPTHVIYPPEAVPNPYVGDMAVQPVFDNLPAACLYRPDKLPVDMDNRLHAGSVWMGVEKDSSRALYFLPPTCKGCNNPAVAQHCDRKWPKCTRCDTRGVDCVSGTSWGAMRPRHRRKTRAVPFPAQELPAQEGIIFIHETGGAPKETGSVNPVDTHDTEGPRLSASAKGKGRALSEEDEEEDNPRESPDNGKDDVEATGRGKRVRKKRRLSADGEVDPNDYDDDGLPIPKQRPEPPRSPPAAPPPRADPIGPLIADPPVSPDDERYHERVEANAKKPPLVKMKGPCPVWAHTRRALQSALGYLRNPVKTVGASVEIEGGIAKGVILEGEPPGEKHYWGTGPLAGTILTSIGKPRPIRSPDSDASTAPRSSADQKSEETSHGPLPPKVDASESTVGNKDLGSSQNSRSAAAEEPILEDPEIEALCMAQRLRSPVALAIAQDCPLAPFKVPRRFVVLGWFWVVDAWVEPLQKLTGPDAASGSDRLVYWKFRFDWCDESQSTPWWVTEGQPDRVDNSTAKMKKANLHPQPAGLARSTTVVKITRANVHPSSQSRFICGECHTGSHRPYYNENNCLNELCVKFDLPRGTDTVNPLRDEPRVTPASLGLLIRPTEPTGSASDATREQAGEDFWRAWVCKQCGMANERRKWKEWECEGCRENKICPVRQIYDVQHLRPSTRPASTGPREDDASATFPFRVERSWSLFKDQVKVLNFQVEGSSGDAAAWGAGAELRHALHTEAEGVRELPAKVLRGFQVQGSTEVPFKRHTQPYTTNRPSERYLSPFYTFLCGPEPTSNIEQLPTGSTPSSGSSVPWTKSPSVCLDAMDLINERAARMYKDRRESFNSLLIAAFPPSLSSSLCPRVVANDSMAFLFLGSDGGCKIRPIDSDVDYADLKCQHGDVIVLKAGTTPLEVILRLDGFGFVCIGRQVYRTKSASVAPPSDGDFPPPPVPSGPVPIARARSTAVEVEKVAQPQAKYAEARLRDWYIGPWPLDPTQPLRVRPAARVRDPASLAGSSAQPISSKEAVASTIVAEASTEEEVEIRYTGIEIIDDDPPVMTQLDPPPSPGKKKPAASLGDAPTAKDKPSKKAQKEAASRADTVEGNTAAEEPKKKKRKSNANANSTFASSPAASVSVKAVVEADASMPSSPSTPSARGGRGRGRGRGGATPGSASKRGGGSGRGKRKSRLSGIVGQDDADVEMEMEVDQGH